MGLDMYLEARKYVSRWNWTSLHDPEVTEEYKEVTKSAPKGFDDYADFAGAAITVPVGYWRKANAIHGWFVSTVQGGVDNCESYYVSRENLVELADACDHVLRVPAGISLEDAAVDVGLMPTPGFFFGSYELDEYYMEDLRHTSKMIKNILKLFPENDHEWSFYYQSSW